VKTSKGFHYYFSYNHNEQDPIGNLTILRDLEYLIDVRGMGGQVVAPGSTHASGFVYKVAADLPVLPLPSAIRELLLAHAGTPQPATPPNGSGEMDREDRTQSTPYGRAALAGNAEELSSATEGERNATLNRMAFKSGQLIAAGKLTREDAEKELRSAAQGVGLPAEEIEKTMRSGLDGGMSKPRKPAGLTNVESAFGSTWEPKDLTGFLDGTYEPPEPTLLTRTDGVNLLYPGAMHSIYGEPESGKSWVFLVAARDVLRAGGKVLFFDFESDAFRICDRLRLLGVSPAAIKEGFVYIQPEEPLGPSTLTHLLGIDWALVGIDGMTQCFATTGNYNGREEDDTARWFNAFPQKFSRNGASVLMMDHVTKTNNGGGRFAIGSMYKLGAIDGASFIIETKREFGKGLRGEAEIRITKDRNGSLRSKGGKSRISDRTQEIARLIIDATTPGSIHAELTAPSGAVSTQRDERTADTELMEKCSRYVEDNPDCVKTAIRSAVRGAVDLADKAVDDLVARGYIETRPDGKARRHKSLKPYRQPVASSSRVNLGAAR
jgi:hypothetical protein